MITMVDGVVAGMIGYTLMSAFQACMKEDEYTKTFQLGCTVTGIIFLVMVWIGVNWNRLTMPIVTEVNPSNNTTITVEAESK